MNRPKLVKEIKSRNKDFSQWYTDVCIKSELIEYSDIKGFFIYLPYSYEIWENIQNFLNKNLKKKIIKMFIFLCFFLKIYLKKKKII